MSVLFCLEPSREELEPSEVLFPRSQGLLPWPERRAQCQSHEGLWKALLSEVQGREILGHRWGSITNPTQVIGRSRHWYFRDIFIYAALGSSLCLSCQSPLSFFLPAELGLVSLCSLVLVTQPWAAAQVPFLGPRGSRSVREQQSSTWSVTVPLCVQSRALHTSRF